MTVSTLRPDSTVSNAGVAITGAATVHGALSDDSDSSYISGFASGDGTRVGFGDLTLPAGAILQKAVIRVRYAGATGIGSIRFTTSWGPADILGASWTSPTTLSGGEDTTVTDAEMDAAEMLLFADATSTTPGNIRVYEVYVDVTYVAAPVVSADAPTGTLTTTTFPVVEWSTTLDADGGPQTRYEVKVFDDATYLGGGFDPDTSTPAATSGETLGADLSWTVDEALADDTYRAYVRVAQTVNGEVHWGDWDFIEFTIDVLKPADPTFTATADNANARIILALDDNAGDATTDAFEVQRSLDGGATWETVRQLEAGVIEPDGAGVATTYDYEAPNGVAVTYRARALHDYGDNEFAGSAWVQDAATWSGTGWQLKHPNQPALNVAVDVHSYQTQQRAGRQGIFQALGASVPVVVADTRETARGVIAFRMESLADQDALDALLDTHGTLLIQGPVNGRPPGYVRVLSHERAKPVDRQDARLVIDALEYVVVGSPPGDVVAWP